MNLYNTDCFKKLLEFREAGTQVDLILTDPPYELSIVAGGGSLASRFDKRANSFDELSIATGYDIETFGELVLPLFRNGVNIYFWCNKAQILRYLNYWVSEKKCKFTLLTWNKTNPIPTYSNKYMTDTEYCLYFYSGKGHCFPKSYKDAFSFYTSSINTLDRRAYGHPTIKPLPFIEAMIRNSTREGEVVLDPFMGSGTTGVGCVLNNREFIGIELDDRYFNVAKSRIMATEPREVFLGKTHIPEEHCLDDNGQMVLL